jgi:hypothetical protein
MVNISLWEKMDGNRKNVLKGLKPQKTKIQVVIVSLQHSSNKAKALYITSRPDFFYTRAKTAKKTIQNSSLIPKKNKQAKKNRKT